VRSFVAIAINGLVLVASGVVSVMAGPSADGLAQDLALVAVTLAFFGVGSFLVRRVPDNAVSWATLGVASAGGVWALGSGLWQSFGNESPPSVAAQVASTVSGVMFFLFVGMVGGVLPAIFPTGSAASPRWRWLVPTILGGWVLAIGGTGVVWVTDGYEATLTTGDPSTIGGLVALIGLAAMILGLVGAVVSLVLRWVGAAGVERLQLRWLALSFTFLVAGFIGEFSSGLVPQVATDVLLAIGLLSTPVAIGLAITRYRLYDVGRVLSRTVAYLILAGLVGLGYGFGAVWLPTQLRTDNAVFVAGTTLGLLMALNPVRRWLNSRLDRRFNRTPYDPEVVADRLTTELRSTTDPLRITRMWGAEVIDALEPASTRIWTRS
jgi:hypothetical protein